MTVSHPAATSADADPVTVFETDPLDDHSPHATAHPSTTDWSPTLDVSAIADAGHDEPVDEAYRVYVAAKERLALLIAARLAHLVREHVPDARTIVLREDTSHLPAHGHLDDILDWQGASVLDPHQSWHDVDWSMSADDDVYEIYDLLSYRFAADGPDRVRRLRIEWDG